MKPEQQRIAIAEAAPRAIGHSSSGAWMWRDNAERWHCCHNDDPLDDLNAMREAEKILPDLNLYRRFLYLMCLDDAENIGNEPAFATAAQRAEAFLRTLGKWEEDKP